MGWSGLMSEFWKNTLQLKKKKEQNTHTNNHDKFDI